MTLLQLIKVLNADVEVYSIYDQENSLYKCDTTTLFYYYREDLLMRSVVTQIIQLDKIIKIYIE